MPNEATVRIGFSIRKMDEDDPTLTLLNVPGNQGAFQLDVDGAMGPVPGDLVVTPQGVDVDFSEFEDAGLEPGLCLIYNRSPTYDLHYGVRDPENDLTFLPFKAPPCTCWAVYISDLLTKEVAGTGTGYVAGNNRLHLRAGGDENIIGSVKAYAA